MPALRVENCPITGQSTSLGTTGHVDGFACHMLGAGVREPRRWRSPVQNANSAWSGPSGAPARELKTRSVQGQTPMDETFDPEKDWNELHKDMESEEDP